MRKLILYILLCCTLLSCTKELEYIRPVEESPSSVDNGDASPITVSVSVSVVEPGTLQQQIDAKQLMNVQSLTVEGSLNGSDLKLIRAMAGCDAEGIETEGRLIHLDLSKAHFVKGGDAPYIYKSTPCYLTEDNVVPRYGFAYCKLEEVRLPQDIVKLNNFAFYQCESLTEVMLPVSIESIGYAALADCRKLNSVGESFPQFKEIGEYAFYRCEHLKKAPIPVTMDRIPRSAFYKCSMLEEADLSGKKEIGKYAFYGCSMLKSVTWSPQLESIGDTAFYNSGLSMDIVFPPSVKYVGSGAFYGTHVTSVEIHSDIQTQDVTFGASHFGRCKSLKSLKMDDACERLELEFSYCTSLMDVHLSKQLKNLPDFAFNGCSSLISVSIPQTVTEMGAYALSKLESLESIQLPSGLSMIAQGLLSECTSLKTIEIPAGVTSIDYAAFEKSGITTIQLPEGVTQIDRYAFRECKSLKSVYLPAILMEIRNGAFSECTSLTDVTIDPKCKLETIGDNAFYKCSNLNSISLPSTIVSLGEYAFSTTGLSSITFPASLTTIGNWCFSYCNRLSSVYNHVTIPQSITSSVFEGLLLNRIALIVPLDAVSAYQNAPVWKDFEQVTPL